MVAKEQKLSKREANMVVFTIEVPILESIPPEDIYEWFDEQEFVVDILTQKDRFLREAEYAKMHNQKGGQFNYPENAQMRVRLAMDGLSGGKERSRSGDSSKE